MQYSRRLLQALSKTFQGHLSTQVKMLLNLTANKGEWQQSALESILKPFSEMTVLAVCSPLITKYNGHSLYLYQGLGFRMWINKPRGDIKTQLSVAFQKPQAWQHILKTCLSRPGRKTHSSKIVSTRETTGPHEFSEALSCWKGMYPRSFFNCWRPLKNPCFSD